MTRRPDDYAVLRRAVAGQHGPAAARILDDLYDPRTRLRAALGLQYSALRIRSSGHN